jgi:hypothetical protein
MLGSTSRTEHFVQMTADRFLPRIWCQTKAIPHRAMNEMMEEVICGVGGHVGSGFVAKGWGVICSLARRSAVLSDQARLNLVSQI